MNYNIGCSGFYYDDWKGNFYPEDLNRKKWLEYYAQTFDTVEMNNSFYRMPKENTVKGWYDRSPKNFKFTLKGSRYITHLKKLNDTGEHVKNFYHMADSLKEKLGCILWQLPGNQHKDLDKLISFCTTLKPEYNNVIEFRHPSWYNDDVYTIMHDHEITFCTISAPNNLPEKAIVTTNKAYIRFHGKKEWYKYLYTTDELKKWSNIVNELNVDEVYLYFNNDYNTHAITNARAIQEILTG